MTLDLLLADAVVADPARPLITYYDDATAERVELSVVTFANWVAKTANLLVDGLGAQPGQRVAIALPAHWQGAVWLAASWVCGLVAVTGSSPARVDIAVLDLEPDGHRAERAVPYADEVVGLGLGPMGLPRPGVRRPPYVTLDYDREIHGFGDHFRSGPTRAPDRAALDVDGVRHTAGDLGTITTERLHRWSLGPGARILSLLPFDDLPGIVAGLLAPLANSGGTVLCRNADVAQLPARTAAENVIAVTGVPDGVLPAVARLT